MCSFCARTRKLASTILRTNYRNLWTSVNAVVAANSALQIILFFFISFCQWGANSPELDILGIQNVPLMYKITWFLFVFSVRVSNNW